MREIRVVGVVLREEGAGLDVVVLVVDDDALADDIGVDAVVGVEPYRALRRVDDAAELRVVVHVDVAVQRDDHRVVVVRLPVAVDILVLLVHIPGMHLVARGRLLHIELDVAVDDDHAESLLIFPEARRVLVDVVAVALDAERIEILPPAQVAVIVRQPACGELVFLRRGRRIVAVPALLLRRRKIRRGERLDLLVERIEIARHGILGRKRDIDGRVVDARIVFRVLRPGRRALRVREHILRIVETARIDARDAVLVDAVRAVHLEIVLAAIVVVEADAAVAADVARDLVGIVRIALEDDRGLLRIVRGLLVFPIFRRRRRAEHRIVEIAAACGSDARARSRAHVHDREILHAEQIADRAEEDHRHALAQIDIDVVALDLRIDVDRIIIRRYGASLRDGLLEILLRETEHAAFRRRDLPVCVGIRMTARERGGVRGVLQRGFHEIGVADIDGEARQGEDHWQRDRCEHQHGGTLATQRRKEFPEEAVHFSHPPCRKTEIIRC